MQWNINNTWICLLGGYEVNLIRSKHVALTKYTIFVYKVLCYRLTCCIYMVSMDYIYVSRSVICALSHVIMILIFILIGLPNAKYKLLSELWQGRKNWFLIVLYLASHQSFYTGKIITKLLTFRTAFVVNKYCDFRGITFDPANNQVRNVEWRRLRHDT